MERLDRILSGLAMVLASLAAGPLAALCIVAATIGLAHGKASWGGYLLALLLAAPLAAGWRWFARGAYPAALVCGLAQLAVLGLFAFAFFRLMSF